MNTADIHLMYDYNEWANARILDRAEDVTLEQFAAPSSHSFGSLHGTLVHTLDTERVWRNLLQSRALGNELTTGDLPTLEAIRQFWREEQTAMRAYIDGLRDADMATIIRYEVPGGILRERVLWHCLYHVVNHGMQHRSECANLLTTYGQSPGDLDFTVFLNGRAGQKTG